MRGRVHSPPDLQLLRTVTAVREAEGAAGIPHTDMSPREAGLMALHRTRSAREASPVGSEAQEVSDYDDFRAETTTRVVIARVDSAPAIPPGFGGDGAGPSDAPPSFPQ